MGVMSRINEKRRAARRQHIMDAAAACFIRHGFHQAGMQQICAEAGMSPGNLYRYFGSKDEIIEAIAESEREDVADVLRELSGTRDLVKSLKTIAVEVLKLSSDTGYGRLSVEVVAEASRNPRVADIIAKTDRELLGALIAALERAQAGGEIDPELTTDAAAEILLALLDGLMSRFLLNPPSDIRGLEAALKMMITRFLRPVEPRD